MGSQRSIRWFAVRLGFSALLFVLLVVLAEGLASVGWVVGPWLRHFVPPVAERAHTRYDPELGWVNIPGTRIPDFYRPGHGITINAQGFRSDREFAPRVPDGWLRAICSGDSFTLGYGVGDAFTWCHQLSVRQRQLETVNLGQGGYGVDQSFLLYRKVAGRLDHDLHIFAFVADDIDRMARTDFLGYGKPVVRLKGGSLAVEGVPVPRGALEGPRLAQFRALVLGQSRFVQLGSYLLRGGQPAGVYGNAAECYAAAGAIFRELKQIAASRGGTLLVVYLPTRGDLDKPPLVSRYWQVELGNAGIPFADLTERFRSLPPGERDRMYIAERTVAFPGAAGHFTEAGHALVADLLFDEIHRLQALSEKLAHLESSIGSPPR